MKLKGKTAIVTGGATGIGRACAEIFCREEANTVIFGRRQDKLEEATKSLGPRAKAVQGDITSSGDLDRLVEETLAINGKIDILVNSAGMFAGSPIHEIDEEQWDLMQNTNMRGVFLLTKRILPGMMERKSGSIIHISSILGMIAKPGVAAYNVSKGALIQFSRSIAVEYGPYGIRSNTICPGLIATEMTTELMDDKELMDEWIKEYPLGHFGKPEDVAAACLYFAADESSFVTGTVLPVDGGFTAN